MPPTSTLLVAALIALVVAGLGGWLTRIGPWYRALRKPSWQPPDWLFGPAWTLIFGLATVSAALAWEAAGPAGATARVIWLFGVNSVLNIAWSGLFFRLRRPDWALGEVIALWLSIAATIVAFHAVEPAAAWLLLPYLGWVAFAGALNLSIARRNPRTA